MGMQGKVAANVRLIMHMLKKLRNVKDMRGEEFQVLENANDESTAWKFLCMLCAIHLAIVS